MIIPFLSGYETELSKGPWCMTPAGEYYAPFTCMLQVSLYQYHRLYVYVFMPQSLPTTGPVRFLSPIRFRACKAEWSARRNVAVGAVFMVSSGYGSRAARHGCIPMVWLNNSPDSTDTLCDARSGIMLAPHGNLQCFSYPTGPIRVPCGTNKGAVRRFYGHVMELTQPKLAKPRTGVVFCRTGPVLAPYGLRMGCSQADYNI